MTRSLLLPPSIIRHFGWVMMAAGGIGMAVWVAQAFVGDGNPTIAPMISMPLVWGGVIGLSISDYDMERQSWAIHLGFLIPTGVILVWVCLAAVFGLLHDPSPVSWSIAPACAALGVLGFTYWAIVSAVIWNRRKFGRRTNGGEPPQPTGVPAPPLPRPPALSAQAVAFSGAEETE